MLISLTAMEVFAAMEVSVTSVAILPEVADAHAPDLVQKNALHEHARVDLAQHLHFAGRRGTAT